MRYYRFVAFYSDSPDDDLSKEILRASQEPCPICGHPTGDCPGSSPVPKKFLFQDTFPSLAEHDQIYVDEDIYGERQIGEYSTVKFLIAKKGSRISAQEARDLGII